MVVVAPFSAVAIWGGAYLMACVHTLEAPGAKVEFEYRSKAGTLSVSADSYSIDVVRGSVYLNRIRIRDPKGNVIASLGSLRLTGLNAAHGTQQVVQATGIGFRGKLTRLRDGRFNIQDFLPEQKPSQKPTPYDVTLDQCQVEMVDLAGNKPWRQLIKADRVNVVGAGKDWVATADPELPGVGALSAKVRNIEGDGLEVNGTTDGLNLGPLVSHFYDTIAGIDFYKRIGIRSDSLFAKGNFRLYLPDNRTPVFFADTSTTVSGLTYRNISVRQARFTGVIANSGMDGVLDLADGPTTCSFKGSENWSSESKMSGSVEVRSPNSKLLPKWAASYLPKPWTFQGGRFDGWLAYRSNNDYRLSGHATAKSVGYSNEFLYSPTVDLRIDPGRASIVVSRAAYRGEPVSGGAMFDLLSKSIQGIVKAPSVNLKSEAERFGLKGISGTASATAFLSGRVSNPTVEFEASGQGAASITPDHKLSLGNIRVVGRYFDGATELRQLSLETPEGLLVSSGRIDKDGQISGKLIGRGLMLSAYDKQFGGAVNLKAAVFGSTKDPRATGRVEGFDVSYHDQSVPAIVSDFRLSRRSAEARHIEAARGTSSLSATLKWQFADGTLSGTANAKDVQLADWLGDEYLGAVDMPTIDVSGTVSDPKAKAEIRATNLIAQKVKVDDLTATIETDGDKLTFSGLTAHLADGVLSGTGVYALDSRTGQVEASATKLSLDKLSASLSDSLAVEGRISGEAHMDVRDGRLAGGTSKGTVDSLTVNGSEIGTGPWHASSDGQKYTGGIEIGELDRYARLENVTFEPDSDKIESSIDLYNFRAETIISAALPYFPALSPDEKTRLQAISGAVNVHAALGGTVNDPSVDVTNLNATNLAYRQEPLGELDGELSTTGHRWKISSLALTKGPIVLSVAGDIDQNGEIHLDGSRENSVDLSSLTLLDVPFNGTSGTAKFKFAVSGQTRAPTITGSLVADGLFASSEEPMNVKVEEKGLYVDLDKIRIGGNDPAGGSIDASGTFEYRGLKGLIDAETPFQYPLSVAQTSSGFVRLTVPTEDLSSLSPLFPSIDMKRTTGNVAGNITVTIDQNSATAVGEIKMHADSFALAALQNPLEKLNLTIGISPREMTLTGHAQSGQAGQIDVAASSPLTDLRQITSSIDKNGPTSLLTQPINGKVSIQGLSFKQKFAGDSSASATATGDLTINGSVQQPGLKGQMSLADGNFTLKGFQIDTTLAQKLTIDPSFDVKFVLKNPARLQAASTEMYLEGGGALTGSLQYPKATANLSVDRGTIRLPAASVRLDQGGAVSVSYLASRYETTSAARVDLEGNTTVSASRNGDTDMQRYDITLGIKGDVLQPNGLSLTATSDPPDLSQDRILAVLGQTDLLQTLSNQGGQSDATRSIIGFAFPQLLDAYTSELARGLGLDFLTLDYNVVDQASVGFGKYLGSNFTVTGSRQLSEPPPGFPTKYDLRIVYRPRLLPGSLSRIRLFFGADEEAPWKLGLDYGVRFSIGGDVKPALLHTIF